MLFWSTRVIFFGSQCKHKRWNHPVYLPLSRSAVKAFIKVSWGTFDSQSAFSSFHSCCRGEKGKYLTKAAEILAPFLSYLQTDPFGVQLRADREASGGKFSRQNLWTHSNMFLLLSIFEALVMLLTILLPLNLIILELFPLFSCHNSHIGSGSDPLNSYTADTEPLSTVQRSVERCHFLSWEPWDTCGRGYHSGTIHIEALLSSELWSTFSLLGVTGRGL